MTEWSTPAILTVRSATTLSSLLSSQVTFFTIHLLLLLLLLLLLHLLHLFHLFHLFLHLLLRQPETEGETSHSSHGDWQACLSLLLLCGIVFHQLGTRKALGFRHFWWYFYKDEQPRHTGGGREDWESWNCWETFLQNLTKWGSKTAQCHCLPAGGFWSSWRQEHPEYRQ